MIKANTDIKDYCKHKKVHLYEVAEYLGIQSSNLSVQLRKELPNEQKQTLRKAIDDIERNRE